MGPLSIIYSIEILQERSRDYTRKFEFLASTMNFLAEHKFDFNTAFSDGVQYLTQEEEKNLKEKHQNAINRLKEQNKNKPAEPEVQNVPDMNKIEDLNVKGNLFILQVYKIQK